MLGRRIDAAAGFGRRAEDIFVQGFPADIRLDVAEQAQAATRRD